MEIDAKIANKRLPIECAAIGSDKALPRVQWTDLVSLILALELWNAHAVYIYYTDHLLWGISH